MSVNRILKKLLGDARGSTAIEYGLIAALIIIGVISALNGVADENTGLWAIVSSKAGAAM